MVVAAWVARLVAALAAVVAAALAWSSSPAGCVSDELSYLCR